MTLIYSVFQVLIRARCEHTGEVPQYPAVCHLLEGMEPHPRTSPTVGFCGSHRKRPARSHSWLSVLERLTDVFITGSLTPAVSRQDST